MAKKREKKRSAFSDKYVYSTVALILLLSVSLYMNLRSAAEHANDVPGFMSKNETALLIQNFIQQNLVQEGVSAEIENVSEESGVYKLSVLLEYDGQKRTITSYATKDGRLFFAQGVPVTSNTAQLDADKRAGYPKSDQPEVELYVMSFCPFGVQAEKAMKPVAELFGDKIRLRVRFIADVRGNTSDSVMSLHGPNEAAEDLRQVCIMQNYDSATYWRYLAYLNENCYPVYREKERFDACWREAVQTAGIDAENISSCSTSWKAVSLLKSDEAAVAMHGIRGSPTLLINGKPYNGKRTSEAFKSAICSAFNNPPELCSTVLQATETKDGANEQTCG